MTTTKKSGYKAIYDLTVKLYGNTLALPAQSKNHLTRWNALFDYWEQLQDDDPLYPVVHKIHWERYPDGSPVQTHGDLYSLIEAEILNHESSVHKARKPMEHIYRHLRPILRADKADVSDDLRYNSGITGKFMYNKTGLKLYAELTGFSMVYCFKKIICKLIPEAKEWSDVQWSDDRNIFDAIQKKYDIDYRLYPEAFGKLYDLLDKMWNQGKRGTYNDIFGVEQLSWKLVEEIWPQNTKQYILDKFCAAKKHIQKKKLYPRYGKAIITEDTLSKSWVMHYVNDLPETTEERRKLFDAMLGI